EHPVFHFHAYIEGEFNTALFPTDLVLSLKRNAQVMFIKNDINKIYVNGTIGKIKDVSNDSIVVTIENKQKELTDVTVDKSDWEIIRYELDPDDKKSIITRSVGLFRQFPLKLAWAITIHKSQGKTFDKVIIDL